MNVASLFSGIGGFEEGLKKAKINGKVVFASEIDKFARLSYKLAFDTYPEGDITDIHEFEIPDHDLLTAGFPCQSFSIAGKRLGFEDTRGTLFFDIARILDWKRPKMIILENVKNLVSHDDGKTVLRMMKILSDLNYTVDIKILNSKNFGTAQSRERTYIVGILNYPKTQYNIDSERVSKLKALKRILNGNESINKFDLTINNQEQKKIKIKDILENSREIDEKYFFKKINEDHIKSLNQSDYIDKGDGILKLFDIPKKLHNDNERQRRVYSIEGIAPTVLARTDSAKILVEVNGVLKIRKLTPLECFRLQGFSDAFYYKLKNNGLSDSQLYKQAGNAVTTTVITAIAMSLKKVLGE